MVIDLATQIKGEIKQLVADNAELQEQVDELQDQVMEMHYKLRDANDANKRQSEKIKGVCGLNEELRAQLDEAMRTVDDYKERKDALRFERDYWKQQVQLCMDAAYPPSHSPERRYDPDVMAYPDRNGCTTPSTLVCDVIDGLRDGFQDKMMPILVEAAEAKQDAERWREGYGRILDEIHEIENTIRELGER